LARSIDIVAKDPVTSLQLLTDRVIFDLVLSFVCLSISCL